MHLPSKPILLVMVLTSMRSQPGQQPSRFAYLAGHDLRLHCRKLDRAGLQVYGRERQFLLLPGLQPQLSLTGAITLLFDFFLLTFWTRSALAVRH